MYIDKELVKYWEKLDNIFFAVLKGSSKNDGVNVIILFLVFSVIILFSEVLWLFYDVIAHYKSVKEDAVLSL